MAHLLKNLPAMQKPGFDPWVGKIHWRRERLPTPVFWPGEFHGLYRPWGHKESDTTERLSLSASVVVVYPVLFSLVKLSISKNKWKFATHSLPAPSTKSASQVAQCLPM